MAKLGLAYDLKTVTDEIIQARKERTGDRTLTNNWGWADPEQPSEKREKAKIVCKKLN